MELILNSSCIISLLLSYLGHTINTLYNIYLYIEKPNISDRNCSLKSPEC